MFTRRFLLNLALGAALAASPLAAQEMSLDQLLQKNLEALGGSAALDKIQTLTQSGKMIMGGGQLEAPVVVKMKRPNKTWLEMKIQGRSFLRGYDGKNGWMTNPMTGSGEAQDIPAKELEEMEQTADMENSLGSFAGLKKAGHTVELLGKEDVEGTPAYKLKVTRKNGRTETHWLDGASFLPLKSVAKVNQGGMEMEVESVVGNYKKIDGVMFAHSVEQKVQGKTAVQMTIEKVELNQPVDDSIFAKPAPPAPVKQ